MQILIVKLGALGDLTFARPALRYLKSAMPDAQIDWLVSEELADFLRRDVEIRSLVTIPGRALFRGGVISKISAVLKARRALAARYDLILLFHRDVQFLSLVLGKGPIVMPTRSPSKWTCPGVTTVVCEPMTLHESLALKRVTDVGLGGLPRPVLIPAPYEWNLSIQMMKITPDRFETIGIHLGGGKNLANEFDLKRWPYMQELVRQLLLHTSLKVRLIGGPDEEKEALQIMAALNLSDVERVENLVARIALCDLQATIRTCDLFFGPDSGPLHIADTIQIPSLGIYGPTSPLSWGLLGKQSHAIFLKDLPCRPCYRDDGIFLACPNAHKCMREIHAEELLGEIKNQMKAK